jgi:RNA polymerase sigma-70 factor, ECF subfamily
MPPVLRRRVAESDVVQEAFTAAFESLGDLRAADAGAFRAWLAKIADRKVTEAMRRHVHADRRAADKELSRGRRQETGAFVAPGTSPSEHALDRERREALGAAVERLPEDYRTILRLVHEEGLTLVEAGERMGRSAEAARKLYGRAAGRLSDLMFGREGA